MAENDPYAAPGSTGSAPNAKSNFPKKPTWTVSRIILAVALLVCVGLLGVDLVRGRIPLWRAHSKLVAAMQARSPADDEKPAPKGPMISADLSPLTADEVHKIVGRDPSETSTPPTKPGQNAELVEFYVFPGVFQRYTMKCTYFKTAKEIGGSALRLVE